MIIIKVKKNIISIYWLIFIYCFISYNCVATITPTQVCKIVKESIENQAKLKHLSQYRELILTSLEELFDHQTNKFLFEKYKKEKQQLKESMKGNYITVESIATIPVGPETLQAKYVVYDIISHKVFLGLTLAFIEPLFYNIFNNNELIQIISEHDITKLNYIEGYQQLHSLLISGYKTAKQLIETNKETNVYRAMTEHKRLSPHHPRYWWEVKRTKNIPQKYLVEMFADNLSTNLHSGGEKNTVAIKIDNYKEYLFKYKFNEGKEWYGKYELMKKLFEYAEQLRIKYCKNTLSFGYLIGLTD